jgi:hypothetical protein
MKQLRSAQRKPDQRLPIGMPMGEHESDGRRVRRDRALMLADRAAAEQLGTNEKLEAQK